jgi:hypothetical protein
MKNSKGIKFKRKLESLTNLDVSHIVSLQFSDLFYSKILNKINNFYLVNKYSQTVQIIFMEVKNDYYTCMKNFGAFYAGMNQSMQKHLHFPEKKVNKIIQCVPIILMVLLKSKVF